MNVLQPELIWIEHRCYRMNDAMRDTSSLQEYDLYENDVDFNDDEDNDEDVNITKIDDSRYSTSLHVPKHYIGHIIGKKGSMKARIEHDTRTEIKIPRQGQTGDVIILGATPYNVKAAYRRINIIVTSSRMKQRPTHFVSIPLNSPSIIQGFDTFKESVIRECPGIDESLFNEGPKLHATIGVMCLMDNEERLAASKLLAEAKEKVVMPILEGYIPFKLRVKGLSYMNDDPREIHVLYALVEQEDGSTDLIQTLSDELFAHFYRAGFMSKEFGTENIKLHVTVLNSKFRDKSSSNNDDSNLSWRETKKLRKPFDGSQVLEQFADYDFGVIELKEIRLSQLHTKGEDGYYLSTSVISIP